MAKPRPQPDLWLELSKKVILVTDIWLGKLCIQIVRDCVFRDVGDIGSDVGSFTAKVFGQSAVVSSDIFSFVTDAV